MKMFNILQGRPAVERRSGEDRRRDGDAAPEGERRRNSDRRGMRHGVLYTTTRAISFLEDWLDANCEDAWNVSLEGISEDLERKSVRLFFMSEKDKQAFVRAFGRKA